LLELARRKGGSRVTAAFLPLHTLDDEGMAFHIRHDPLCLLGGCDPDLFALFLDQTGTKGGGLFPLEISRNDPVFLWFEVRDLLFPLADQAQGDRLDSSRREPPSHLLPEEGTDLVTYQSIEDPTGLLGLELVHVQLQGVGQAVQDGTPREVIEEHAVNVFPFSLDLLGDMPGNGLSFTIGVRGEKDGGAFFAARRISSMIFSSPQ